MANDKKFVVKRGLATPNVDFANGGGSISATFLSTSNTLSFSGNTGQLFSITDSMSGTIFSVNDISGIPSIEVIDTGAVKLAETFGSVAIGANTVSNFKFNVTGNTLFGNSVTLNSTIIANGSVGTAGFVLTSNGTGLYWAAANSSIASIANAVFATTANNSLFAYGKQEGQLSVSAANNSVFLVGRTWETAGTIGSTVANTGAFTTLSTTGNIQQQNANYLSGRNSAGGSTRLFGVNSANTLYVGAIDTQLSETLFVNNGVEQMRIQSSGNVSIGSTATPTKLFVNGHMSIANGFGLFANGTLGTSGFVLASNGTSLYWANATSISGTVGNANNAIYLAGRTWETAGAIGSTVANTGAFTTLSSTGVAQIGRSVTQAAPSATDILSTAHASISGQGGNLLTFGQYDSGSGFAQWIQSSFTNPTTATYNIVLQPLGGNVAIGSVTAPTKLYVNGHMSVANGFGIYANGTLGTSGFVLTSNGTSLYWANAASISGTVGSANNSAFLVGRTWETAGAIGSTVANTGAFTTITASANVNFDSGVLFADATSNRVGVGTATPLTRFHVGSKVADDNVYAYDGNTAMVVHQQPTSTTVLNDPKETFILARQGTGGQAYGAAASFDLSRYENSGVNSRTRLDFKLAHGSFLSAPTIAMTMLSSGNIGIGTSSPTAKLHVVGDARIGQISNSTTAARLDITAGGSGSDSVIDFGYWDTFDAAIWHLKRHGADNTFRIAFAGSGSEVPVVTVNGTGNVGFGGNTTPGQAVQVDGSIGIKNGIVANGSFGSTGFVLTSNGTVAYWANATAITGTVNTANNSTYAYGKQEGQLSVAISANSSALQGATWQAPLGIGTVTPSSGAFTTITASANVNLDSGTLFVEGLSNRVGIGNTTPERTFHVTSTGLVSTLLQTTTASSYVDILDGSNNYLRLGSFGGVQGLAATPTTTPTIAITSTGRVGVNTNTPQTPFVVSNAGAGGLEFDGSTGLIQSYNRSTSAYQTMLFDASATVFRPSGTERMRVNATGVGIGNTNPGQTLQVDGSVGIKNGLVANGSFGTAGFVLTSNGSVVYWANAAAISGTVLNANNSTYAYGKQESQLSVADSTQLGSVAAANYTRKDLTYLGSTGSIALDSVTDTAGEWSALPVGYARMFGNGIGTAGGAPVNNYGYFFKVANRDTAGGWGGLWAGYSAGQNYIGRSADSSTLATWDLLWSSANDGAGSTLDADLLDGQHGSYYTNADNIGSGTLAEARLPFRMNQNVRTTDNVTFANLTITGSVFVTGNVTTFSSNNVLISDNMIYLNANSTVTNPDIGLAANYNDGTYRHTGIFRDATDGMWKVFDQYLPEPDASPYINTANASFRIADFQANSVHINALYGNSKEIFNTSDSYLRINQSNGFTNGIWMSGSNLGGGAGTIHMGSNGDPAIARVRIIGGTYNGSTVITLNGTNGNITASNLISAADLSLSGNMTSATATVNSGSVYRSDWTTRFQSSSDFADGTLVTTDIPATATNGDSFIIEITGKSYSSTNPPFKVVAQGYLYTDTIINFSGINYGGTFSSYIKAFQDGGVLKFWWPRISYWNSFNVNVMSMDAATNGTISRNRVTAIGNATEPTGTKKVQINLATSWDSTNFTPSNYLPLSGGTMTGAITFAGGQTWPTFNQSTTGSAATLTTARNINGTSFNGSADITTANWGTSRTLTIGSTGKSVNGSGNVSWTHAELGAVRNLGVVAVQAVVGSNQTCTTAEFVTWLTGIGAFAQTASVMKCSWDYAGNNDLSDTGFGQLDLAGCIIETFTDGGQYIIRVTSPSTGSGSGGIHEYINHGGSYSPGWRRVYTSALNGNISGSSGSTTGNAATATALQTARTINGVSFDGTANITVADNTKLPLAGGTLTGALTTASAAGLGNGNARSLITGYSGGNYGQTGYGIAFTTTSDLHNYAINDAVSLWEAVDGLRVKAAAGGTVGTAITWTTVLDARRTMSAMTFKGNTVLDSANYGTYAAAAGHTHTIAGITDAARWWNNFGDNHGTRSSFDATSPSIGFGWRYVQGSTNGPGVNSAGQYYSLYTGLGNDYGATGAGSYGMQIAFPRNVSNPYIAIRYNESNSFGAWQKISAGYADSAGSVTNGVYTTGDQTIGGTKTFSSTIAGSINGNAATVTNGVYTSGDQTIAGTKTFSSTISGSISGNAATATTADQIDGIGFRNTGSNSATNADTIESNGITYYSAGVSNFSGNATDGALYSQAYSASWQHQIAGDYRSGQIALRGKNNGTWQSWRTVIDSGNYNSYAPTLGGTGASGTWSISVTGNAVTAGGLAVHGGTNNEANKIVRTDANGYIIAGYINSANGNEANNSNPPRVWGTNGSDSYLRTYLTSALSVGYAASAGTATDSSKLPLAGGTMTGMITGMSSSATDVNTDGDNGSISIRGGSTTVAMMSFHRVGAYAMQMGLGTDNVFRIGGWSASDNAFQMDGSGNLTMLNNVTAYSDLRLKKDIVKIDNALEKVGKLNGYTYTRTDTDTRQMGVIAQEVMEVIPEVVLGSEETNYSVAYGNMVGLLIEAIKELKSTVDEQQRVIDTLTSKKI